MNERVMPRHEWWREQYRRRRYLQHVDGAALGRRFADILTNVTMLTTGGQIGLVGLQEGGWLLEVMTHAIEEYNLRGGMPGSPTGALLPRPTHPHPPRMAAVCDRYRNETNVLVKYGKEKHLRSMVADGQVRVAPASSYGDPSLNPSLRDDELTRTVVLLPSEVRLEVRCGKTGKHKGFLQPSGSLSLETRMDTDYYVYCVSRVLEPRLFDDFDADACVVIRDPAGFRDRLLAAFERASNGHWNAAAMPVAYVDPFNHVGDLAVPTSKHFRYWYQREYRLAWVPEVATGKLDPLLLVLGNLSDICELAVVS